MLPTQQIDGLVDVFDAEVLGEGWMFVSDGFVHLPGYAAVTEMAGRAGAKLGDVLRFGEVHFEEAADPRRER